MNGVRHDIERWGWEDQDMLNKDGVSVYVFVDAKRASVVQYCAIQFVLPRTEKLYRPLERLGLDWRSEFKASDEDTDLFEAPRMTIGYGHEGAGMYSDIIALQWGEGTFILGSGCDVGEEEPGVLTLYRATAVMDGETIPGADGDDHGDIRIALGARELSFIQAGVALLDEIVDRDWEIEGDDAPQLKRGSELLESVIEREKNIYTKNWDDLDDLMQLSLVWPWTLQFRR